MGFDRAEKRLEDAGLEVMRESADAMKTEAISLVPVDTGALRSSIEVQPRPDGASVRVGEFYGVYLEYGTGLHAEGGDGRKTPWSYIHPRWGWVTTEGGKAQPFMRPAFPAGVAEFYRQKRQRGL